MERDGLLRLAGDRHLELSDHGRLLATRVMRKHRLAERLLVDVIGLEWEYVHDEACRWEHVMSERVERKILAPARRPPRVALRQPDPRARRARARSRTRTSAPACTTLTELARRRPEPVVRAPDRRAGPGRPRGAEPAHGRRAAARASGSGCTVRDGRVVAVREGAPESTGVSLPDDVAQHVFGALV